MAKILLVEDDKSLREIYGVRLMAEGYEIVSAGDGEEALAMAIKERPDLIVSDVMMPKISGFDMLDILRSTSETKDVKVIMMTALSSDDQRARGESLGADRYLVKSQVGIEDVVRTVHDVLGDSLGAAAPATPAFDPAATPVDAAPNAALTPETPAQPAPTTPTPVPEPPVEPAPETAPTGDLAVSHDEPTQQPDVAPVEQPAAPAPTPDLSAYAVSPDAATPVVSADTPTQPVTDPAPALDTAPQAPVAPVQLEVPEVPAAPETPAPVEQPAAPAPTPDLSAYAVSPEPNPAPAQPELTPPTPGPLAPAPIEAPAPEPMPAPTLEVPAQEPAPAPAPTPTPEAPAQSTTISELPANPAPLPQPTAPFSTPAPASLGERIIEPLTAPVESTPADIASQMAQALNDPSVQSTEQGPPPAPPVQ